MRFSTLRRTELNRRVRRNARRWRSRMGAADSPQTQAGLQCTTDREHDTCVGVALNLSVRVIQSLIAEHAEKKKRVKGA